jgi:hypothetical protein
MTFEQFMTIFHEEAEKADDAGLTEDETLEAFDSRIKAEGITEEESTKYHGMMLGSISYLI